MRSRRNNDNRRKFKHTHVREGIYIKRILKQINSGTKIQVNSIQVITSLARDISKRLVVESAQLLSIRKKSTLTAREIQTSIRLHFPGELAKHAVSESLRAVTVSDGSPKKTVIPASFVKANIKSMNYNFRISKNATIYLAATIEYILFEILELANNSARDNKKLLITPRNISLAIHNDEELDKLVGSAIIPGGGVNQLMMQFAGLNVFGGNDNDGGDDGKKDNSAFSSKKKKASTAVIKKKSTKRLTGGFSFGTPQPDNFSFGAAVPQAGGFGFGAPQPGNFSFGAPQPNSFSFGGAVPQTGGFSFGAPQPNSFSFGGAVPQQTGFAKTKKK